MNLAANIQGKADVRVLSLRPKILFNLIFGSEDLIQDELQKQNDYINVDVDIFNRKW